MVGQQRHCDFHSEIQLQSNSCREKISDGPVTILIGEGVRGRTFSSPESSSDWLYFWCCSVCDHFQTDAITIWSRTFASTCIILQCTTMYSIELTTSPRSEILQMRSSAGRAQRHIIGGIDEEEAALGLIRSRLTHAHKKEGGEESEIRGESEIGTSHSPPRASLTST